MDALAKQQPSSAKADDPVHGKWNGEYYVSFGGDRSREEARKYGFISAGGGSWYTRSLGVLEPDARIWVSVPGTGYVGVGIVTAPVAPLDDFTVEEAGKQTHLIDIPCEAAKLTTVANDPEKAEHFVGVRWLKTLPVAEAISEKGFFGNQNTVARPISPKWAHTVERLKKRFGVA